MEPASSNIFQSNLGAYSTSLSFAVGNLDGNGIQPPPQLSVSPTSVSLSVQTGQTATRTVQIANTGSGTLTWTSSVTPGANWLSILPTGGTAPSTATLQINATALAVGSYTGKVRISGQSGVVNSPQDITVNLTVTAQPAQLSVTPTQITLSLESGQSATQQVQIANTGSGPLNWTATLVQGAPWLSFSPSSGTAPSTLTLTVNAAGVQPGQYTGTVRVAGSAGVLNSPQDVTVNLTVTAPPANYRLRLPRSRCPWRADKAPPERFRSPTPAVALSTGPPPWCKPLRGSVTRRQAAPRRARSR